MTMNDFINEINQDMREERWRRLWRRYGIYLIGAALAVVLFVAGRQGYVAWQESSRNSAADAYLISLENSDEAGLATLAEDGGEGYPMLARFQQAISQIDAGDKAAAEEIYLGIAGDTSVDRSYRDAALILSVLNAPDGADTAQLEARLALVISGESAWRFMAYEVMIGLALERGDLAAARENARTLRDIGNLPEAVEQRLRLIEVALGE